MLRLCHRRAAPVCAPTYRACPSSRLPSARLHLTVPCRPAMLLTRYISTSSPLPPPRLPDPPRAAHRPSHSHAPLPQSKAEQDSMDLIKVRREALEEKSDASGGIPGGSGLIFIVVLLMVVLSLNYHRAEAVLEISTAEHDVQVSRLKIQLQQLRDLTRDQSALTSEYMEGEALIVASELRVSEADAKRVMSQVAERVNERITQRVAIIVPPPASKDDLPSAPALPARAEKGV